MKARNFTVKVRKLTVGCAGEESHGKGQKLSDEARNFTVKGRKVTVKTRNSLRRQGISV